jgi:glycosyl transferase family 1
VKRVVFLRDFHAFRGGHLKVFHYFQHVRSSPRYEARVRFTEDSVWNSTNPWWELPGARLGPGEELDADVIVLAARSDWLALAPEQRAGSPVPIINLIQGFRHIRREEAASQFLSNRAIRICVTPELEQALRADGSAAGPLFTIPIGLDLDSLPAARPPQERDLDCAILAVKDRPLGRSLARRLKSEGRRVQLIDRLLERAELLDAIARAKVSVHLPAADEGAYLPALESMALGTLVVCPDCVGNRSFCRDGETCAVPDRNEGSLLAATERLLKLAPAAAEAMRLAGHAVAATHALTAERASFLEILDRAEELWREPAL